MAEKPTFDVGYVADLARLQLSDEEKTRYQSQLEQVLDYMNQIDSIDVSGIEPTAHATPVYNVMREDVVSRCLARRRCATLRPRCTSSFWLRKWSRMPDFWR